MTTMLYMNIFLIALLLFTVLLVWSRNWNRKQAYLDKIKSNPDNLKWIGEHLSGEEWQDLKTISKHFALPLLQTKQLINFYIKNKKS